MSIEVAVDPTNPGQFFACCGLFELSTRLDPETIGHFQGAEFKLSTKIDLPELLRVFTSIELEPVDSSDETASPILLGAPFGLRLDWWKDEATGGRELKVWAGTMQCLRMFRAMVYAMRVNEFRNANLFSIGQVVYDPTEPTKKVEPFYFDARRASNAHSRDVGFSVNDLGLTTTAFPAVEALCLVGLQRCRPAATPKRRVFEFRLWQDPIPLSVASAVIAGAVPMPGVRRLRFEAWFRTSQKKHKAFRAAIPIGEGD